MNTAQLISKIFSDNSGLTPIAVTMEGGHEFTNDGSEILVESCNKLGALRCIEMQIQHYGGAVSDFNLRIDSWGKIHVTDSKPIDYLAGSVRYIPQRFNERKGIWEWQY